MSAFLFYLFSPLVLAGFLWEAARMAFAFGRSRYVEVIKGTPSEAWKDHWDKWRFDK